MSEATQRKLPELHFAVLAILSVVEQGEGMGEPERPDVWVKDL